MKPFARPPPLRRPHPGSTNDLLQAVFVLCFCRRVAVKQVQRPFMIPFSKYRASCISLDITRILFLNVGIAVIIRVHVVFEKEQQAIVLLLSARWFLLHRLMLMTPL